MRASTAGSLRQANENYHEESATVPAPLPQWPIAKGAGFAPSASGYATGLRERLDLPCRVAAMRGSNRANSFATRIQSGQGGIHGLCGKSLRRQRADEHTSEL